MIIVDFARIYGKFEDAHIVTIKSICRFFNEEFLLSVSTLHFHIVKSCRMLENLNLLELN